MTNTAINYISGLNKNELSNSELNNFISLCEKEQNKNHKKDALENLLNIINLTPNEIKVVAESELVKYSIDLQYSLKKYVSAKAYREAEVESEKETTWHKLLLTIGVFPTI